MGRYDDIINLPHHVSKTHPQMSNYARAAQFAPFAALTGYGDAISEAERRTEERIELSDEYKEQIESRLQYIYDNLETAPRVEIIYFVSDERKDGGKYVKASGKVVFIDEIGRILTLDGGEKISADDIYIINFKKADGDG